MLKNRYIIFTLLQIFILCVLNYSCRNYPDNEGRERKIADMFVLKPVPAGIFTLQFGGPDMPITRGYLMAETEVTQELWQAVMSLKSSNNVNPSTFADMPYGTEEQDKRPVENITWYDAIEFCNELSDYFSLEKVYTITGAERIVGGSIDTATNVSVNWDANGYRLPTEMEWMWAAMGADTGNPGAINTTGYDKAFAGYTVGSIIDDYAWYRGKPDTSDKTHQVRLLAPNELGLYDMSGNVYEWCWDRYDTYPSEPKPDYKGPDTGSDRVLHGGYWYDNPNSCAVAELYFDAPNYRTSGVGFRFVRNPD